MDDMASSMDFLLPAWRWRGVLTAPFIELPFLCYRATALSCVGGTGLNISPRDFFPVIFVDV